MPAREHRQEHKKQGGDNADPRRRSFRREKARGVPFDALEIGEMADEMYDQKISLVTIQEAGVRNAPVLEMRVKKKKGPGYGKRHLVLFIDDFPAVVDLLTHRELRVLARVLQRVEFGEGHVPISGAAIARETNLSPAAVSAALSKMRALNILIKASERDGARARHRVNRQLCWKGSAMTYQRAQIGPNRNDPAIVRQPDRNETSQDDLAAVAQFPDRYHLPFVIS